MMRHKQRPAPGLSHRDTGLSERDFQSESSRIPVIVETSQPIAHTTRHAIEAATRAILGLCGVDHEQHRRRACQLVELAVRRVRRAEGGVA